MTDTLKKISHLIEQQFPDLYKSEGPNLIKFVEAYYEWMQQEGNPINLGFTLAESLDIDTTLERFLSHFRETYMVGLPEALIGNQRLLQKHILDLYRAKNSKVSVELLFRLLYNKDIELYIPSTDILRTSDGKWQLRSYMEVTYTPDFHLYADQLITGTSSGAAAYVVGAEVRLTDGVPNYILYIEDVRGEFTIGESVRFNNAHAAAQILGSVNGFTILTSQPGWTVGEQITIDESERPLFGETLVAAVTETYQSDLGVIEAVLVDGGTGYTNNAVISITNGTNTIGSGAEFAIGSLINTSILKKTDYTVSQLLGKQINSADYDINPNMAGEDRFTPLATLFEYYDVTIGTIGSLITLNPGSGYDGSINITITDPDIAELGYIDPERGTILGTNAVVDNFAVFGENLARRLTIKNSGFGYHRDRVNLTALGSNNIRSLTGRFTYNAIGRSAGRYTSRDGFLSSSKKLQDSYYYQEYSYEIRSSESLARYAEIVKAVVHPSGNELFGAIKVADTAILKPTSVTSITQA